MSTFTADTLTQAVIASAANAPNARARTLFAAAVKHLHAFVREVELTPEELMAGIRFLTATGQMCDELRQEFILLSDTLGVTMMVDTVAHQNSGGATESSVLGPFFTTDAPDTATGESIASEEKGEPLLVHGVVRSVSGEPIAGAVLDVWETDSDGLYDTQYAERPHPDCRGRVRTQADGTFRFRAVVPVSYPVPTDGPVGKMLLAVGRHPYRPAHLHFAISAEGYAPLTTALYVAGDPYLDSDAVFGVKPSLVEPVTPAPDGHVLQRDFVMDALPVLVTH
ncbi:MAG: dioxygenase [Candidatus Velthaea sp.]|jgi:protocatechuate 3,4-dioxygenase beta subunit